MSSTPDLIRRNTLWLAASQIFVGAGTQLTIALAPLMVLTLLGSPLFAGLSTGIVGVSRFIAGYPLGRLTDRYGRKPGLFLGLGLACTGALIVGTAMSARSFPGVVVGLFCFASGMNGVQQLRLAAAEMYPPRLRGTIIGLMLTGSLVGVVVAPSMVHLAESLAGTLGTEPLAMPWFLLLALILPAVFTVSRVRPDPRQIAVDLARYYPGESIAPPEPESASRKFGYREFAADPRRRLAAVTMFASHAAMQMAMVSVPLQLVHHGHTMTAIALSSSIHVGGMFGPSIPLGRLADRIGPRSVLVGGLILEAIGVATAVATGEHFWVTVGIFLVGVGWCGTSVASTAAIVDATPPFARGRAVGLVDSVAAVGVIFPLSVGVIAEFWGVQTAGAVAMLLLLLPFPFIVRSLAPMQVEAAKG